MLNSHKLVIILSHSIAVHKYSSTFWAFIGHCVQNASHRRQNSLGTHSLYCNLSWKIKMLTAKKTVCLKINQVLYFEPITGILSHLCDAEEGFWVKERGGWLPNLKWTLINGRTIDGICVVVWYRKVEPKRFWLEQFKRETKRGNIEAEKFSKKGIFRVTTTFDWNNIQFCVVKTFTNMPKRVPMNWTPLWQAKCVAAGGWKTWRVKKNPKFCGSTNTYDIFNQKFGLIILWICSKFFFFAVSPSNKVVHTNLYMCVCVCVCGCLPRRTMERHIINIISRTRRCWPFVSFNQATVTLGVFQISLSLSNCWRFGFCQNLICVNSI